MKGSDWGWGIAAGVVVGMGGLALRGVEVGWPLEGLFAQITHWMGVPIVFNLMHKLLGYGDAGKNLAFAGTALAWLFLHSFLFATLRRWFWPGAALTALFYGFFGGWVSQAPLAGLWATLLYGGIIALLAWRRNLVLSPAPSPSIPPSQSRRESLKTLGLLALGLVLWQQVQAQASVVWQKITGLSRELFGQKDLYYVSKNIALLDPKLMGKPYKLEVSGLVHTSLALSLDDLKALPSVELVNTLTCISNPIGGDLIGSVLWKGTPLKTMLDKAGIKSDAKFIVWEAADRYLESIPIAEVPREAIIAYAVLDPETGRFEDLTEQHGYPTRILLPGRYGMKQPRWLTKITLSSTEVPGYWAQRGWSRTAHIRTMSRIDTPQHRARLKAGEDTFIAGIAYAGGRTLERVEVSSDGGKSWQKAQLKPPKSTYAWQLWALPWKPAAGSYTLVVRAVEAGGQIQDATLRDPLPDGATGYHRIQVRVD